ncbi:hypothetical protein Kpol_1019p6 [Vanderwaltozyma polyspora DSM 70294]|uniref:Uncharacterized protein n=1 Tax=Vanderwaltozyma polyspora (strain ATCC 22028 / DSM 70294 / BCRC 21397 / CBS 2163 / NBRC 10782 / NRRL Y-8283 / UCD 57-17) TaxID=436907 RepID=A7TP99_VANPO|nr:uncharacterized protein Kpol_1019p6 [Vanderwaltozyma polyspora DSM 70294]EDO15886.1 hypothetical protein Kpol_1019p6 [Vanderwaltozyma polyspora DSM 70294]
MRTTLFAILLGLLINDFVVAYKPVIEPKEKLTTTETPKPWVRTIYSGVKEIVTPTIIAGVTFSAKPPNPPNPLQPWVSLKNDGIPVTIKPQLKNGITKKASPTYSTYFMDVKTHTFSFEELEAHNMDPNDVHEEEEFIPEDDTYLKLNPIIRCAPDRYSEKGLAKNIKSEPFCTPREATEWRVGRTYFVSWFTRFFKNEDTGKFAEKVRVHLMEVPMEAKEKGYHNKRSTNDVVHSSDWLKNLEGIYPITPEDAWLEGEHEKKFVISVQPDYISDEDFDPLEYGIFVYILLQSRVYKHSKEQIALENAGLTGTKWYYIALSMPAAVAVALFCMYVFLRINKGNREFSDVTNKALKKKHRVIGKISEMSRFKNMKNHKYEELPTYQRKSD